MSLITIAIGLALFALMIGVLRGAMLGRPSIGLSLLAASLLVLGALGSWYSWMEPPGSLPWALGYGAFALAGGITLVRQVTGVLARSAE